MYVEGEWFMIELYRLSCREFSVDRYTKLNHYSTYFTIVSGADGGILIGGLNVWHEAHLHQLRGHWFLVPAQ